MSDSHVESLLKQMSLKAPSDELDGRIGNVVQDVSLAPAVQPSSAGWRLVYTVAAVCLLIGVAVGRLTSPLPRSYSVGFAEPTRQVWAPVDGTVDLSFAQSSMPEATAVPVSFNGPQVAVFCSATPDDVQTPEVDRCSRCHTGVKDKKSSTDFHDGVTHLHQVHRQLCARCHTGSEEWMPHEVDSAIFGVPHNPHATSDGVQAFEVQRCSKCHMGGKGDKPTTVFYGGMARVHRIHSQLCTKCHTGPGEWMPHEIDHAIFGVPHNPHANPAVEKVPAG